MLARLQQAVALLWLATLLAGPWAWWQAGHPLAALACALLLLMGHALWLALGMVLAWMVNRRAGGPQAPLCDWGRAWWGEVRCAPRVFGWRQPFRSRAWPDHLPATARGRRGVLLVHGFVCNRGLWNPWLRRFHSLDLPVVAVNLEPVFGQIDDYRARIEQGVARLEAATGVPPLLVGHSMGGLAIRAWLAGQPDASRAAGVVTIGTPHGGTWLARWAFSPNGRQMRPGSDWLRALAAAEAASGRETFTCCFSPCDHIVFPADTALLPGAQVCHVAATAHVDLVHHPRVMVEVLRRLGLDARAIDQALGTD